MQLQREKQKTTVSTVKEQKERHAEGLIPLQILAFNSSNCFYSSLFNRIAFSDIAYVFVNPLR